MSVRLPAVAGYFYPKDRESLREEIKRCFLHRLGPGKLPESASEFTGRMLGLVSPHAGYVYSGPVAAHGYFELALSGKPDVVIILGPNHHAYGDPIALSSCEVWETPLGSLEVDLELSKEIARKSKVASFDDMAHRYEHSIEVQLPFLQFVFGSEFRIVPISMMLQNPEASRLLGIAIASAIKEHGLRAYVIASSDMTHYEPQEVAERKDKLAIQRILELDYKGLYDVVIEQDVTMCGYGPVMTLIVTAKELGAYSAKLLKYATSGDVTGDYSAVVGYASVGFYRIED